MTYVYGVDELPEDYEDHQIISFDIDYETGKPIPVPELQQMTAAQKKSNKRFREKNGVLCFEAENWHASKKSTYKLYKKVHRWVYKKDKKGFTGNGFMNVLPDERPESAKGPRSPRDNSGARLDYRIKITNPGTYIVYVRGYAIGGESNGVHVGFNGKIADNGSNMSGFRPYKHWIWEKERKDEFSSPARMVLKKGNHILNVWNRDDMFRFDKIVLVKKGKKINLPDGSKGPPQSAFK
eukprot:jgi/Bigna1/77812/fgenesh1_pg.50_\